MTKLVPWICLAAFCCAAAASSEEFPKPSRDVHAFYYGWYGNPETDGGWRQWNHRVLLRNGQGEAYAPPDDIGANFYPADGLYSSSSRSDVARQMGHLRRAGVGVVAATWWGPDDYTDRSLAVLFDLAAEHDLQVCFHIEPYPGRNAASVRESIVYLLDRFGSHPGLYRCPQRKQLPMFYLYDSYLTPAEEWAALLRPEGSITLRGTPYDAVVIALWVKKGEEGFMTQGGFDGFYTYFATDGFTYGSSPDNWPTLAAFAAEQGLLFIPSVGPGYADTRIRPWNNVNTRSRENGAYYDRMFESALKCNPPIVSITSFNEWHEGTQIEPAAPKEIPGYRYEDYGDQAPDYYLKRTLHWMQQWTKKE